MTNDAKAAVNGLAVTAGNYEEAIDILRNRFGDTAAATREHFNRLYNFRSAADTVSQIQRFYDEISVHVRNLDYIGVSSSSYEIMLLPILLSKLPESTQSSMLHRAKDKGSTISTIACFLKLLEAEIKVKESICEDSLSGDRKPAVKQIQGPHIPTVTSLGTESQPNSTVLKDVPGRTKVLKSKAKTCPYCSQDHLPSECTSTIDSKEQIDILKRDRRCF